MKTKFKKNGRRLLAAILCLVMAVMALPLSAFAWTSEEGVSCTSSFGDYYVGSDGGYYRSKSSYSFIVYDSDGNTSVRTISAGNAKRKYLMTDSSGTHQVYCVESGIDFNTGNSYVSQNGKNSSYFRKLPTEAQFGVMMALMYGWHEGKSSPVAGTNTDDYAFATQTIIWEYQQQLRTSPSDLHSANGIDADTYRYSLKGRPAEKCYDWILSQMASHYTIPSFAARNQSKADTYTLKYNPDRQNYSLTLTDTNNTLANLSLSASGIKKIEGKRANLIDLYMSNLINKDEFTATRASCDAEIEELQSIIESVDKQREMIEQQQQLLKEIEDAIKEIVSGVEYEDEFYKHILDKMVVQDKDNIDVYLNLLPMKWSYTVAKASKKAVASEWNISEASLPISVSRPRCSSNGME